MRALQLVGRVRTAVVLVLLFLVAQIACFFPSPAHAAVPYDINTVAGDGNYGYTGDGGQATSAHIKFVKGLAMGINGAYYLADSNSHVIRKVAVNGVISTVAGTGTSGTTGDGGQATSAQIDYPEDVVVDASGNLYISTAERIRKVDTSGVISTIAGNGSCGHGGDGGQSTSAQLCGPRELLFDAAGNLYIAVEYSHAIRKIATNGVITTIAGTLGSSGTSGDGGLATSAKLNQPVGIAFDSSGNLFIADKGNHRIRKIAGGVISAYAGTGVSGYNGDGGLATAALLNAPQGIAIDLADNVVFSDPGSHTVRVIKASTGIISTLTGTGSSGYAGDGGKAGLATLNQPYDVEINALNDLYITDAGSQRVRLVWLGAHEEVDVRVTIDPYLGLQILNKASICNGQASSGFTDNSANSPTSFSLGHLAAGATVGSAQRLLVTTNAAYGYALYLKGSQASQNLRNATHSFSDVSGSYAVPGAFGSSEAFGYTIADPTLGSSVVSFTSGTFAALDGTNRSIMGIAAGPVNTEGCIGFQAEASGLTPAGSYAATIIYTIVPVF